jgi:hypothetical protein
MCAVVVAQAAPNSWGTVHCYYRSLYAEPGKVPPGWRPPQLADASEEEVRAKVEEYKRTVSQEKSSTKKAARKKYVQLEEPEFRYCGHCEAFKPERTHHCRECKRCVLMMDHHW